MHKITAENEWEELKKTCFIGGTEHIPEDELIFLQKIFYMGIACAFTLNRKTEPLNLSASETCEVIESIINECHMFLMPNDIEIH